MFSIQKSPLSNIPCCLSGCGYGRRLKGPASDLQCFLFSNQVEWCIILCISMFNACAVWRHFWCNCPHGSRAVFWPSRRHHISIRKTRLDMTVVCISGFILAAWYVPICIRTIGSEIQVRNIFERVYCGQRWSSLEMDTRSAVSNLRITILIDSETHYLACIGGN